MLGKVLSRLVQLVLVLVGVSVIVFLMTTLTPGDPVELILGTENVTAEEIANLRRELGLDDPLLVRYFSFVGNALTGNFGTSFYHSRPVSSLIIERLPATVELTIAALAIAFLIAVPLGALSALRKGSLLDTALSGVSFLAVSMPGFWFGVLLILLFSVNLGFLPVGGRNGLDFEVPRVTGFMTIDSLLSGRIDSFWNTLKHLAMPALTLGLSAAALLMRVTRNAMVEVLNSDYVLFARAKGLSKARVIFVHALRNALVPVVTLGAIEAGAMLGGSVIIETVFAWPGLGSLVGEAIFARNYPLVQTSVLLFSVIFVLVNFLADLLYTRLDRRIGL